VGAEGFARAAIDTQRRRCSRGEIGEPVRETRPPCPVTIFVPPPILQKELAVLDLPVIADRRQQLVSGDIAGIEAGQEVASVRETYRAVFFDDVSIDAQRDLTAWKTEPLANVLDVV